MKDSPNPNQPEDQLPHEVVAALKRQHGPQNMAVGDVPESVDQAILTDAAAYLKTISSAHPQPRLLTVPWYRRHWIAASISTVTAATLLFLVWPADPQMEMTTASREASSAPAVNELAATALSANARAMEMSADQIQLASNDVDQNGTVNILDAFALARSLQHQDGAAAADAVRWDQNGDGQADTDDVQLIAMAAVTL